MPLPTAVSVDLRAGPLRDYWLARAAQHTTDVYCGVPISKFPEDLRVYEHLLWGAAPSVVVELGTQFGGGALWFRDRLRTLASYGRIRDPLVVSVDVSHDAARSALGAVDAAYGDSIRLVEGDVRDPDVATAVTDLVGGRDCFVVEDTAHVYETTMGALRNYSPLIHPGGYLVVEDGCVDLDELRLTDDWPRGVLPALEEWLSAQDEFVVRRDLELYGVSCHPKGFLQRSGRALA